MNWVVLGLVVLLAALGVTGVLTYKAEIAKTASVTSDLNAERAAHSADVTELQSAVQEQMNDANQAKQRAHDLDQQLAASQQHAQELQNTVNDQKRILDSAITKNPATKSWAATPLPPDLIEWLSKPVDPAPSTPTGSRDQDGVRLSAGGVPLAYAPPYRGVEGQLLPGYRIQGPGRGLRQVQCGQGGHQEIRSGLPDQAAKVTLADRGSSTGLPRSTSACWGGLAGSPDRPSTFILLSPLPEIRHNG